MTEYEKHCQDFYIADASGFLQWILERNGKPASVGQVPINFASYYWVANRKLAVSQQVAHNTFTFAVTDAGMAFLKEHGWKGDKVNLPLDTAQAMAPEESKPLTSVWLLPRNRQIVEFMDLSKVPSHVLEVLKDNRVAVINGQLYAVSFEELMGTEYDPTLE